MLPGVPGRPAGGDERRLENPTCLLRARFVRFCDVFNVEIPAFAGRAGLPSAKGSTIGVPVGKELRRPKP